MGFSFNKANFYPLYDLLRVIAWKYPKIMNNLKFTEVKEIANWIVDGANHQIYKNCKNKM